MNRIVLVTGATGQQGGAVVNALLADGHTVRAMTRNPQSASARKLTSRGVEVICADFAEPDSLAKAMSGVDTVFAVTTPFEEGEEAETRQGLGLVQAAKESGVGHFIYSSVSDADRKTGVPHFESKFKVEQALVASGLSWTIVAPVYFMDNILSPFGAPSAEGVLSMAVPANRTLQQIAVEDIGRFVALVVVEREKLFGRRINIAGDDLTGEEMAAAVSAASGRSIVYQSLPTAAVRTYSEDLALMFEWFDSVGYSADASMLRKEFPSVGWQDYPAWAAKQVWDRTDTHQ